MLQSYPLPDSNTIVQIAPGQSLVLGDCAIDVIEFLGQCLDVYYFQVQYQPCPLEPSVNIDSEVGSEPSTLAANQDPLESSSTNPNLSSQVSEDQEGEAGQPFNPQNSEKASRLHNHSIQPTTSYGLLRIGQPEGALQRELRFRQTLNSHRMVVPLIFSEQVAQVELSCNTFEASSLSQGDPSMAAMQQGVGTAHCVQESEELITATLFDGISPDRLAESDQDPNPLDLEALVPDPSSLEITSADISVSATLETEPTQKGFNPEKSQDATYWPGPKLLSPGLTDYSLKSEYLEEEEYELTGQSTVIDHALITLSFLPDPNQTLAKALDCCSATTSLRTSGGDPPSPLGINTHWADQLSFLIQLCQMAKYLHRQGWCWVNLNPQWIELAQPIRLYDFVGIFQAGDRPSYGISGNYWPPELLLGHEIDEPMVSFSLAAILYHLVHGEAPSFDPMNAEKKLIFAAIPGVYQVLRACLVQGDDRPRILELLSMLVDLQHQCQRSCISWVQGSGSTLGLSDSRWTNEDSYGVRYQVQSPTHPTIMLGILADGMGGLEQGEAASQCAVQTLLAAALPGDISQLKVEENLEIWQKWLIGQVQKANQQIFQAVRNGGTTLSAVLGVANHLLIGHVGDSRIFLIRHGIICQLSEDHSLVQTLWLSGQISYAEMQDHPDRNVILKSLGSSQRLPESEVQTLQQFGPDMSLLLQSGDLVLLCSDGVWDLVPPTELCELFAHLTVNPAQDSAPALQAQVNQVLQRVLDRGAHDNATIVALQCLTSPLIS